MAHPALPVARVSALALLLAACAVDGAGDPPGGGGDPACSGDKCDDLDGVGDGGVTFENPCATGLEVSLFASRARQPVDTPPLQTLTIGGRGGSGWFDAQPGDEIAITDVGGSGWRSIAHVDGPGRLTLDPGYCPWDVFLEGGSVIELTAEGDDWDSTAVGDYARPDPYVEVITEGEYEGCKGYPVLEGTTTSTADDTTSPVWNQKVLSWVGWHDISTWIELRVTDDDVGIGGQYMGGCRIEGIPRADALPAVITSDCDVGSFTIRIEPAGGEAVETENVPIGAVCG